MSSPQRLESYEITTSLSSAVSRLRMVSIRALSWSMARYPVQQLKQIGVTLFKSLLRTILLGLKKAHLSTGMVFYRPRHRGLMACHPSSSVLSPPVAHSPIRSRLGCTGPAGITHITAPSMQTDCQGQWSSMGTSGAIDPADSLWNSIVPIALNTISTWAQSSWWLCLSWRRSRQHWFAYLDWSVPRTLLFHRRVPRSTKPTSNYATILG